MKNRKEVIHDQITGKSVNWPTIENQPLNEYTTPYLATMAFPTLFPDAKGDPTIPV